MWKAKREGDLSDFLYTKNNISKSDAPWSPTPWLPVVLRLHHGDLLFVSHLLLGVKDYQCPWVSLDMVEDTPFCHVLELFSTTRVETEGVSA